MTYIEKLTGKKDAYWLDRINKLIRKHAYRGKDPVHDEVEPGLWLADLISEIDKYQPGAPYDGNMYEASVLSYILMKWWVRLVRAKSYDPRRPIRIRKKMLKKMSVFCAEVMAFMTDESEDPKLFPDQEWDNPFAKEAKNGSYI